jgi:cytochrome c-type biogenesis protein CcsB
MAVINTGLAQLSEGLWGAATGTYMLAVVGYTAEYAFGRKGMVANMTKPSAASPQSARVADRSQVLAGAGGPDVSVPSWTATDVDNGAGTDAGSTTPGTPFGAGRIEAERDPGHRWGVAAVWLTLIGMAIHLTCVVIRGIAVDRVPWGNMYEFTLVVGFIAALAWMLTLLRAPQLRYLGMFVMLPVLVVMFLAGTLYTKASKLVPALQSYWLAIHVSSIAVAEGIMLTSAALTIMYLVRARYERLVVAAPDAAPRRFADWGAKFPAADSLDKAAYRTVAFAFPIYTAGVIFGAIWAEAAWGRYWGWDPKETWAFIAWVVYATYLHARATAGWKGSRAGFINLLGFSCLTFNLFVVNIVISGLHSYAGLS